MPAQVAQNAIVELPEFKRIYEQLREAAGINYDLAQRIAGKVNELSSPISEHNDVMSDIEKPAQYVTEHLWAEVRGIRRTNDTLKFILERLESLV